MSEYKNVCDIPLQGINDNEDKMEMSKYINGLVNFIEYCDTPMTISIQGEWGSGKTSLINNLNKQLSDSFDTHILNTWDYALVDQNDLSMSIFKDFLLTIDPLDKENNISEKAKSLIGSFVKIGTRALVSKYTDGGIDVGQDLDKFINIPSLSSLKNEIKSVIDDRYKRTNKKMIFFIDDLDRLNPPDAIKILELLKNLFDQPHCIFVLALDYDIVVKGLKAKFGDDEKNEREYRQFFDKIVQLPFSMPIENYSLDRYLENLLVSEIGFISEDDFEEYFPDYLGPLTTNTIGKNPRALKRVVNYLSLIKSIISMENSSSERKKEDKVVQYGLLCIQVAYPEVYSFLSKNPNFKEWNKSDYSVEMFEIKINEEVFQNDKYFDEDWEKTLYTYVLSTNNNYLIQKVRSISVVLNTIKDFFETHRSDENFKKTMDEMIELSSITNASVSSIPSQEVKVYKEEWQNLNLLLKDVGRFGINKNPTSTFIFDKPIEKLKKPKVNITKNNTYILNLEFTGQANSNMHKNIKRVLTKYEEIDEYQKEFKIEVKSSDDISNILIEINKI